MPDHIQPFLPDLLAERLSGKQLRLETLKGQLYLPFNLVGATVDRNGIHLSFWQDGAEVFARSVAGNPIPYSKFILSGMLPVAEKPREPTRLDLDLDLARYRLF